MNQLIKRLIGLSNEVILPTCSEGDDPDQIVAISSMATLTQGFSMVVDENRTNGRVLIYIQKYLVGLTVSIHHANLILQSCFTKP
ncbi:MAG: hypothetical protein AAF519_14270 [Bacteroidota bacterium]